MNLKMLSLFLTKKQQKNKNQNKNVFCPHLRWKGQDPSSILVSILQTNQPTNNKWIENLKGGYGGGNTMEEVVE